MLKTEQNIAITSNKHNIITALIRVTRITTPVIPVIPKHPILKDLPG
jgi:hypothetical protein